jgi:hypothetical protein
MTDYNYLTLRPGERCLISATSTTDTYAVQLIPVLPPAGERLSVGIMVACMQYAELHGKQGWMWVWIDQSSKERIYDAMLEAECMPGRWYGLTVADKETHEWISRSLTSRTSELN